ncbi:MAG: hypothetical protein ACE5IK_07985 [Acidobacteriota bacterium]
MITVQDRKYPLSRTAPLLVRLAVGRRLGLSIENEAAVEYYG